LVWGHSKPHTVTLAEFLCFPSTSPLRDFPAWLIHAGIQADWAFKPVRAFSLLRPWPMQRRTREGHYG